MRTSIPILFFLFQFILCLPKANFAQAPSKSELCQHWVIKKGWFGDDMINLEILNKDKQKDLVELLIFNNNGSLTEELFNPQHLGLCGNGMLYFESATWRSDTNSIVFDVKGGRFAESKFHYIMTYEISSFVNNKMTLKKKNVQLNEVKNY